MKKYFYSFMVGMLLFGSMIQADSSLQDLPKPSEPEGTSWLGVALCAAVTGSVVYFTYELYQSTKNLK